MIQLTIDPDSKNIFGFTKKIYGSGKVRDFSGYLHICSRAIIYYNTQSAEVLARSPGYLNLMTTQERLATLLVRVSYPGGLALISLEEPPLASR